MDRDKDRDRNRDRDRERDRDRDGMNDSIRFEFDLISTRGPAHLITLNHTLLFMKNYKCRSVQ